MATTEVEQSGGESKIPKYSYLNIVPDVLIQTPQSNNAIAMDAYSHYVYIAGTEGIVRKYNFHDSISGKVALTQNQKHGLIDLVNKGGVFESSWENVVPKADFDNLPIGKRTPVPIFSLAVSRDSLWALTGQKGGPIKLWTVRVYEGKCHHVMRDHTDTVCSLALFENQSGFISASWDKSLIQWDLNTGQNVRTFKTNGHASYVTSVGLQSADNQTNNNIPLIVSSGLDGQTLVWDSRTNEPAAALNPSDPLKPSVYSTCWSPSGETVFCGKKNETLEEWDFRERKMIKSQKIMGYGAVTHLRAFPNGKYLLCSSEKSSRLFDLSPQQANKKTGNFQILPAHLGTVCDSFIDNDCSYILTTSGSKGLIGNPDNMTFFHQIKPEK